MEKHVIADVMFDIDDLLEFNKSRDCDYAPNDPVHCPVATFIQSKSSGKAMDATVTGNTTMFDWNAGCSEVRHPAWLCEIVELVDEFDELEEFDFRLPPEEFEKILNKTKERYANA